MRLCNMQTCPAYNIISLGQAKTLAAFFSINWERLVAYKSNKVLKFLATTEEFCWTCILSVWLLIDLNYMIINPWPHHKDSTHLGLLPCLVSLHFSDWIDLYLCSYYSCPASQPQIPSTSLFMYCLQFMATLLSICVHSSMWLCQWSNDFHRSGQVV